MDNQTKKLLLLALSGDATAQNDLGCAYSSGQGVEQDFAEAIKWWRKAADCDLPGAALNLGIAYLSGQGVPQDYAEAARWNRKAAEQGLAGAEHNLGNAYFKGQGVPQNYTEAVKWYRRAAYQGLAASQYSLGLAYANGNGVGQDYLEAARWYLKSAEQGDVDAQYNLAGLYAQGLGVAQDLAEAEKWWIKAAAQGDDQAKKCLQALYSASAGQNNTGSSPAGSPGYSGCGSSRHDTPQDLDDPDVQFEVGNVYYFNSDSEVCKDKHYDLAVMWWRKAADLGHAGAQFSLGFYGYGQGKGIQQDYAEAAKWYRKSAEQGYPRAQCKLGFVYLLGQGVEKNESEAAKWFQKAAEQGDNDAENELGKLYYNGRGVARNEAEALKWYRKAAEHGNPFAKETLDKIQAGETSQASQPDQNSAGDSSVTPDPKYYSDRQYSLLSPVGWFTMKGRIGVAEFWSRLMIWSLLCFLFFGNFPKHFDSSTLGVLVVIVLIVFISGYLSILARRYHDLNWSFDDEFRVMGLFVCFPLAIMISFLIIKDPNVMLDPNAVIDLKSSKLRHTPVWLVQLVWAGSVLYSGYILLKIGFAKGTDGSNQYGPDPTK